MDTRFNFKRCIRYVGISIILACYTSCTSHRYMAKKYQDPIHIAIAEFSRNPGRFCTADGAWVIVDDYDSCTLCVTLADFRISDVSKYPEYSLKSKYLPSEYLEYRGRLFYWDNGSVPVTQEVIDKLIEYHLINPQNDTTWIRTGETPMVNYYFCKSDYSKYVKRVQIYYKRPKCLECEPAGPDWHKDNAFPIHGRRLDKYRIIPWFMDDFYKD